MNKTREKVSRIIDEILMFQFNAGITDTHMDLRKEENGFRIVFTANCENREQGAKQVETLNRFLKVEKNEAVEAYFWELAGDDEGCDDSELQLIGQMLDEADARMESNLMIISMFKKF
ncbi:hypothetical protein [Acidaminobacterium chupaoyuni]